MASHSNLSFVPITAVSQLHANLFERQPIDNLVVSIRTRQINLTASTTRTYFWVRSDRPTSFCRDTRNGGIKVKFLGRLPCQASALAAMRHAGVSVSQTTKQRPVLVAPSGTRTNPHGRTLPKKTVLHLPSKQPADRRVGGFTPTPTPTQVIACQHFCSVLLAFSFLPASHTPCNQFPLFLYVFVPTFPPPLRTAQRTNTPLKARNTAPGLLVSTTRHDQSISGQWTTRSSENFPPFSLAKSRGPRRPHPHHRLEQMGPIRILLRELPQEGGGLAGTKRDDSFTPLRPPP